MYAAEVSSCLLTVSPPSRTFWHPGSPGITGLTKPALTPHLMCEFPTKRFQKHMLLSNHNAARSPRYRLMRAASSIDVLQGSVDTKNDHSFPFVLLILVAISLVFPSVNGIGTEAKLV